MIEIHDQHGFPRIAATENGEHGPVLSFLTSAGEPAGGLVIDENDRFVVLLADPAGKIKVGVAIGADGQPEIFTLDEHHQVLEAWIGIEHVVFHDRRHTRN